MEDNRSTGGRKRVASIGGFSPRSPLDSDSSPERQADPPVAPVRRKTLGNKEGVKFGEDESAKKELKKEHKNGGGISNMASYRRSTTFHLADFNRLKDLASLQSTIDPHLHHVHLLFRLQFLLINLQLLLNLLPLHIHL